MGSTGLPNGCRAAGLRQLQTSGQGRPKGRLSSNTGPKSFVGPAAASATAGVAMGGPTSRELPLAGTGLRGAVRVPGESVDWRGPAHQVALGGTALLGREEAEFGFRLDPSARTGSPRPRPRPSTERTMAAVCSLLSTERTNDWSILIFSNGTKSGSTAVGGPRGSTGWSHRPRTSDGRCHTSDPRSPERHNERHGGCRAFLLLECRHEPLRRAASRFSSDDDLVGMRHGSVSAGCD